MPTIFKAATHYRTKIAFVFCLDAPVASEGALVSVPKSIKAQFVVTFQSILSGSAEGAKGKLVL